MNRDYKQCYYIQRSLTTDAIDFDSSVKILSSPGCFISETETNVYTTLVVVVRRSGRIEMERRKKKQKHVHEKHRKDDIEQSEQKYQINFHQTQQKETLVFLRKEHVNIKSKSDSPYWKDYTT